MTLPLHVRKMPVLVATAHPEVPFGAPVSSRQPVVMSRRSGPRAGVRSTESHAGLLSFSGPSRARFRRDTTRVLGAALVTVCGAPKLSGALAARAGWCGAA
jgi:hypothetical protein